MATKVQVGTETVFVEASHEEVRSTLAQAAVGSHVITVGVEAGDEPVLRTLANLTIWAEAAQRRADPEAFALLEAGVRRWRRLRGLEAPALAEAA